MANIIAGIFLPSPPSNLHAGSFAPDLGHLLTAAESSHLGQNRPIVVA
jgi:hypothetical protein